MNKGINAVPRLGRDKNHDILPWLYIGISVFLFSLFLYPIVFKTESMGDQLDLFYDRGGNFFADLFNVCAYSADGDPYFNTFGNDAEKAYLPLSYLVCFVIGRIINFDGYSGTIDSINPIEMIGAILIFTVTTFVLSIAVYNSVNGSVFMKVCLIMAFLTSGPFMFAAERWNLVFYTVIGMVVFLSTYDSENKALREFGYLSLAVAAAFKGYPAILGLLLIYRKEWKEAARLFVYGLVVTLAPFLLFKHGFGAIPKWFANLGLNNEMYKFRNYYGYSYFVVHNQSLTEEQVNMILGNMRLVIIVLAALAIIGAAFVKKPWIRISLLLSFVVIIPVHGGYYTLLYFIPLVAALINEKGRGPAEYLAAVIFAIIMMPFRLSGANWFCDTRNTTLVINSILLTVFVLSSLYCIVAGTKGITGLIKQKRGINHGKARSA